MRLFNGWLNGKIGGNYGVSQKYSLDLLGADQIIQNLRDGILLLDPSTLAPRFYNTAAAKLLNLSESNLSKSNHLPSLLDKLAKTKFVTDEVGGEFSTFCQNTGEVIVNFYGRLLKSNPKLFLVVLYDVTTVRKLERMRTEFIANVSHELKTPITSIRGSAETLLDGALNNREDAIKFLEMIGRQAERLSLIFDDMLALSKIEQDEKKTHLELEHILISELLIEAIELCEQKADVKQVVVNLECENCLESLVNPRLLHQAVVNLIDNAIKYSHQGGQIIVSAEKINQELVISVKDNGKGIDNSHLTRIFERFYRVNQSRGRSDGGGTGLGLAIVKHIAQVHGGRVIVESMVDQGSKFTLLLPIRNS